MGSVRDSVPDPHRARGMARALRPAWLPPLPSTGLTLATSPAPGEDSLVDRCNCSAHMLVPACVCPPPFIARPPGSLRDQDDSLQHDSTRRPGGTSAPTGRAQGRHDHSDCPHVRTKGGLGSRSLVDALSGIARRYRLKQPIITTPQLAYSNYWKTQDLREYIVGGIG